MTCHSGSLTLPILPFSQFSPPCLLQFVHTSVIHHPVLFTPIDVDKWQCRQAAWKALKLLTAVSTSYSALFVALFAVLVIPQTRAAGKLKADK